MLNIGQLASKASKFAIDRSPTILTAIGVAGVVTTAYLAGKAAWNASDLIRLKEADDEERGAAIEDPREILKDRIDLVWRLFVPAVATGCASIACIIGAQRINSKRAAGLAALYSLAERSHSEYAEKVKEKFGERKEEQVRDEVNQDRVTNTYTEGVTIEGAPYENSQIFLDKFSGRYFYSDVESIRSAVNDFNKTMLYDGYLSVADFYEYLALPAGSAYLNVGWRMESEGFLDIRFSAAVLPVGSKPCMVLEFKEEPKPDFNRFR